MFRSVLQSGFATVIAMTLAACAAQPADPAAAALVQLGSASRLE